MYEFKIPESYEEWHHCITVICRQPLSKSYIESRIKALNDAKDHVTERFVELYGDAQRVRTLEWFEQAKRSL